MAAPALSPQEHAAQDMAVTAELACVLTVSERTAGALLSEAHTLTTALPTQHRMDAHRRQRQSSRSRGPVPRLGALSVLRGIRAPLGRRRPLQKRGCWENAAFAASSCHASMATVSLSGSIAAAGTDHVPCPTAALGFTVPPSRASGIPDSTLSKALSGLSGRGFS